MESINIIFADDIEPNHMFMKEALKKDSRINIIGNALDGEQEYELIKKYNPDLVITDNTMPKMKGIEVIRKIASEDLIKKPAFMIISAESFGKLEEELNVIGVFGKPVDYDRILRCIDDYMKEDEEKVVDNKVEKSKKNISLRAFLINKFKK